MDSMMRIAIIDDESPSRHELGEQLLEILPEATIAEADSGAAALRLLSSQNFDLLLIDINLGDMGGLDIAAAARKMQPDAQIVFATAYSKYAVDAFDVGAVSYLLKPYDIQKLRRVVEECRSRLVKQQEQRAFHRWLPVTVNRCTTLVDTASIVFIETSQRGCVIHTTGGEYAENLTLGDYEKRLDNRNFFRIHKSFLVNLNYLESLFPWNNNSFAVHMRGINQTELPVGREKLKELRQILNI